MTTTPNPTPEQIEEAMFLLFPIMVRYDGDEVPNPGGHDKREGFRAGIQYMRALLSEPVQGDAKLLQNSLDPEKAVRS